MAGGRVGDRRVGGGGGDRREKDFPPPFTTSNNLTSNHDNKQRHYKYSVEGGRVGVSWEGGGWREGVQGGGG